MCGICGFLGDFPPDSLIAMRDAIAHRGPDDAGLWRDPARRVALGHRRLSIIDLSPTGHQPMQTDDGTLTIVYNGEIYNFLDLRSELESAGIKFRGRSDTEVALYAFRVWGPDCFRRFNGMFGMAIWDARTSVLYLARDRFGIKFLYYAQTPNGFLFGSEIKSLLTQPGFQRRLDWHGLHEYLYYGNALRQNTIFEGVRKVLPGHYLAIKGSTITNTCYWRTEEVIQRRDSDFEAASNIRTLLEKAVADHLISDVPVGVFLSGGIDSSAITALGSRHYNGRLKTYSVGFDFDTEENELAKARRVATLFNTEHHEIHIEGRNLPDVIEKLVRCHDEPFADAADIPLYLLCESLKGSVKVILQGDGGDEIFAGYRRYNILTLYNVWRLLAKGGPLLAPFQQFRIAKRGRRFLRAIGHKNPELQLALWLTQEDVKDPPTRVLSQSAQAILSKDDPFVEYRAMYHRFKHLDPVQRMLYIDSNMLLVDTFLEKVDKPTMAHGIEVRVPFLDANLTAYAMGLPSKLKVRRGQKKYILRRALRGIVPDDILDAPKAGFGVPYYVWLKGPLADYMKSVLLDSQTLSWDLFDQRPLAQAIDEHVSGRRHHGPLLWKLLNFALWYKFYLA